MIRILELKTNPLFRDKIPPLTQEEFDRLEQNILADGKVRDPIIVWNGTIIDGHNRYKIIQKHPDIPFTVEDMNFSDDYEAVAWMCANQIGRRNLSDVQLAALRGEYAIAFNKSKGAPKGNENWKGSSDKSPKLDDLSKYRHLTIGAVKSAEQFGSKPSTVQKDISFVKGLNKAEEVSPGFKEKILSGEVKIPKFKVAELRKAEPEERKEKVEEMLAPKPKSEKEIRKAINNSIKSMQNSSQDCTVTIDDAINQFETDEEHYTELVETSLKRYSSVIKGNEERIVAVFEGLVADLKRIIKEYKLK